MAILFFLSLLFVVAYLTWRFGPMKCPQCRKLTFGRFGPPVGIRRMHFHCTACGLKFTGHERLPL